VPLSLPKPYLFGKCGLSGIFPSPHPLRNGILGRLDTDRCKLPAPGSSVSGLLLSAFLRARNRSLSTCSFCPLPTRLPACPLEGRVGFFSPRAQFSVYAFSFFCRTGGFLGTYNVPASPHSKRETRRSGAPLVNFACVSLTRSTIRLHPLLGDLDL